MKYIFDIIAIGFLIAGGILLIFLIVQFLMVAEGDSNFPREANSVETAKILTMDIYRILKDGKKEFVKEYFDDQTRNEPGFDDEVEKFMMSIGGKIVTGDVEQYHYDVPLIEKKGIGDPFDLHDFLDHQQETQSSENEAGAPLDNYSIVVGIIDHVADAKGVVHGELRVYCRFSTVQSRVSVCAITLTVNDDPDVFYAIASGSDRWSAKNSEVSISQRFSLYDMKEAKKNET